MYLFYEYSTFRRYFILEQKLALQRFFVLVHCLELYSVLLYLLCRPTKASSTVLLSVRLFVPVPGYFNKAVTGTRVFCRGLTERTKASGSGMGVVPSLPYQSVGYGYGSLYQSFRSVGYGTARCTPVSAAPVPAPRYLFQQGRTRYQDILARAYRTYQSVGHRYGSRTTLTKVLGVGNT